MLMFDDWDDDDYEPAFGDDYWDELKADTERDEDGDKWRELLHARG